MRPAFAAAALLLAAVSLADDPVPPSPIARRYAEGQTLVYRLRATNHGRDLTTSYSAQARGFVRRDPAGQLYEEFAWIDLARDGQPVELAPATLAFRQRLSLTRDTPMQIPDLTFVHPALAAPVLDLLSFYGDLSLAGRLALAAAGDHAYFPHNRASSWADGRLLLIGESSIDFDVTLVDVKPSERTATLVVRHVAPPEPAIKLAAEWMRKPVGEGPNNWTQVRRAPDGKYFAAIGREAVNVTFVIDTSDGRILTGTLDNPVEVLERECEDFALEKCGAPARYRVFREVELIAGPASRPE